MPSFSDLPGCEGFCFFGFQAPRWSRVLNSRSACGVKLEISAMRKLTALVAGGAVLWFGSRGSAITIQEDFKTNPAERGWRAFGAGELFAWDQAGGAMAVTWDSSL